jgi:hypothetical protein
MASETDFQEHETYKGFTILGRIVDLQGQTQWQAQFQIGHREDGEFVQKLPMIDRKASKLETGALNLGLQALEDAHTAIDKSIA